MHILVLQDCKNYKISDIVKLVTTKKNGKNKCSNKLFVKYKSKSI